MQIRHPSIGFNFLGWYTSTSPQPPMTVGQGLGQEESYRPFLTWLYSQGVRFIRVGGTDPIFGGAVPHIHQMSKLIKTMGFDNIEGWCRVGQGNTTTPVTWATHAALLLNNVIIARDNDECNTISVGNEEEERIGTQTLTSLSRTSNVATAVFSSAHGYVVGQTVIIAGATPSNLNGTFTITGVPDTTSFTYTAAGVDGSATGTITAKMTVATLIGLIKALAVQCRAVAPGFTYVYSSTGTRVADWVTAGFTPGVDLDKYGVQHYGSNALVMNDYISYIQTAYDAFGANMWVTEWNLYFNWETAMSQAKYDVGLVERETRKRCDAMIKMGVARQYFFYIGGPGIGQEYTMVNTTNEWAPFNQRFKPDEYYEPRNGFYALFAGEKKYHITDVTRASTTKRTAMPVYSLRKHTGVDRGKCINFNESPTTNSYLSFTVGSQYNPPTLTKFTACFRVFPRGLGGGSVGRLISGVNQKFLELFISSSGYNAQVWFDLGNGSCLSKPVIFNKWQTVIVEADFTNTIYKYPRIYVDCVEQTSSPTNWNGVRTQSNIGNTIYIGNRSDLIRGYDGLMDDYFCYPRLLTARERNAYHNGHIPQGFIHGLTMDEASGTVVDISGNGMSCTPSNVIQNVNSYTYFP